VTSQPVGEYAGTLTEAAAWKDTRQAPGMMRTEEPGNPRWFAPRSRSRVSSLGPLLWG